MGFEPVLCLLLERSTNAVLVQTLVERWWDTTHAFHIADREMTITPYDFHRMTDLWFDGVPISLENESGTQLGAKLLEGRYAMEMIRTLTLRQVLCVTHGGWLRSVPGWPRSISYTCWGCTYSPMGGRWWLWCGWPFSETLRGLGLPIGGTNAWPTFTLPLIRLAKELYAH